VFTYRKKFVFLFLNTISIFQTPGQGGGGQETGTLTLGQGHQDKRNKIAGTDVIDE